jgi:hypothetical protein
MEHCDRTDFLNVEPQSKDSEELLGNQAGAAGHPLNPAHCGAIVAEESYPLFSEGNTDMLHHEPKDDKPC